MTENDDIDLEELSEPEEPAEAATKPVQENEAGEALQARTASDLAAVFDIPVNVSAVLGKSTMFRLHNGSDNRDQDKCQDRPVDSRKTGTIPC